MARDGRIELIKIGAKVLARRRSVAFELAKVAAPRDLFRLRVYRNVGNLTFKGSRLVHGQCYPKFHLGHIVRIHFSRVTKMANQQTKVFATIIATAAIIVSMTTVQAAEGPKGVDHYLCYEPSKADGHGKVDIKFRDQFGKGEGIVVEAVRLCNPVDKNGEGIINREAHLLCYYFDLQDMPGAKERTVLAANQFGETKMVVAKPNMICVPSFKKVLE